MSMISFITVTIVAFIGASALALIMATMVEGRK